MSNAQYEDCRTAYVICSDSSFSFLPTGGGIDDFANPNNDEGCLFTRENISAWFYFELREDMPLDSNLLGFQIVDTLPGYFIDYDFAIYGPNLSCDSLGSPYRCSFARLPNNGNLGRGSVVSTGFSSTAQDTSESFGNADGFLKPMDVKPGDGFYLVIDFFVSAFPGGNLSEFDSTAIQGFKFFWGGSAAPWLNCIVNPNCDQVTVDVMAAAEACAGEDVPITTAVTNTNGNESYIWSEVNGRTNFLSDPSIANPILNVPVGFSGTLEYTLLVKEGACEHTDSFTITIQDGGVPGITGDNVVCEGELATLTAEAGFTSYLWSTGETTQTIMVAGGQNYKLTVTSGGGACPGVGEFFVQENAAPRPFIRGDLGICQEGRTRTVLRAPLDYESYFWQTSDSTSTNEFITVESEGEVLLTVTDSIGCETTDTANVFRLPEPIPEIIGDGSLCEGTLDTLGLPPIFPSATWTSAEPFRLLSVQGDLVEIGSAGIFSVEVEDTLGCIGRGSFDVIERLNPTPAISGDFTFCSNEETELSGPAGFEYLWSTGDTTETVTVDSVFSIALLVRDTFGCEGSTSASLDTLPLPQPQITGIDYICEGGTTFLTADAQLDYLWSTGDTTESITVDMAGTYEVSVTGNNGCTGDGSFMVGQRINPIPAIVGDTVLCPGEITSLNSVDNFTTYNWSTGSIQDTTPVDQPGIIMLSVVDSFGCPGENTINVIELIAPVPLITGDTAFCEGDSTTLSAEAGFVTYAWPDGSTDLDFTALNGGQITLTVTDVNGCEGTNALTLDERAAPVPQITGDTAFCANESGVIRAPIGFTAYSWSNGQTSRAIEIFDPGIYEVTVVDDVGCTGSALISADTVSLPQPAILGGDYVCETGTRLLFTESFVNYNWSTGDTTGATTITAPGIYSLTVTDVNGCRNTTLTSIRLQRDPVPEIIGDPILCPGEQTTLSTTFNFDIITWSTGETTDSIQTGFIPEISIEVQDTFGCIGVDTIQLNQVDNPVVNIAGQLDICDGEGAILEATDGFPSYEWSNGSDSLSTIGRVDGIYTVTVTDGNGCQASASRNLRVNSNPKPEIQGTLNICEGEISTLTVRSNFLSYNWSTSDNDTTSFVQVRTTGDYIVEVTSPGGCTNSDTVFVQVNRPRVSPINNAVLDICTGETLVLDGGPGFINYQWSNGSNDQAITVANGGRFNLSVIDSNGCRTQATLQVREQDLPVPIITAPDVFCKGTPVALLAGGNYRTYEWSNGDRGDIIEITEGGRYELTVTDNNGCKGTLGVDLEEREAPEIEIAGDLKICRGDTATLSVPEGFIYYLWTDDTNENEIIVTEPGNYGVLVVSPNGCTGVDEVQVLFRPDPLPIISGDLTKCSNETGQLDAGPGYESYRWLTGDTTQQVLYDTAGIYEVEVTDDFGCSNIARVLVDEVQAPQIVFDSPPGICPGDTITLSVTEDYNLIDWSTGASEMAIEVTAAGVYTVMVSDTTNCMSTDSIEITAFSAPNFNLLGDTLICEGESARIALDRIFPSISWSTGSNGTSINVDSGGVYTVLVTNAQGCETEQARLIQVNPAPPVLIGPDTILNCFNPEIRIGAPESAYNSSEIIPIWTGPSITFDNELEFQPLINQPGIYTLRTENSVTGCLSDREELFVDNNQSIPNVELVGDSQVNCITGNTLIDGSGSDQSPSITYQWLAGPQDSLIASDVLEVMVNQPLLYKLRVLDTLSGCSNIDSITLQFDAELPAAVIAPVDILSCDEPSQTLMASSAPINSDWSFFWVRGTQLNDSIQSQQLTINQPGVYYLEVVNERNGCIDTDSVEIIRNDIVPDISAGPDVELDCNVPDIQLGEPFAESRWIISWSRTNDPDFVTAQPRPIVAEAGEYNLEVLDPVNGCISYDTAVVTVYDNRPEGVALDVQDEKCFNDRNGQIIIGAVTGGEGPYIYSLNNNEFTTQTALSGLAAGQVTLIVQDIRGCEYDTMVVIDQGVDPFLELGPDRKIDQGEYVRLSALTNIELGSVEELRWLAPDDLTCDTCQVQRLAPLKTTEYIATVVDTNGCAKLDSVVVFVDRTKRVFIPNIFSPNGDGNNDRVTVFTSANAKKVLTFRIFERRGNMVFQRDDFSPNDLSIGWDGFHRGRLLNNQVFAYYAEVEFEDGEIVVEEGSITLAK
ncbi:MAG: hypothetical protein Sapg2KO_31110 [Saprospiraceae bacterium]